MKIIIGLGSNLGRRKKYLVEATHRIINLNIINQAIFSSTYESEAQLPEGAPANWNKNFLNLAIMGETSLAVEDVLVKIKGIEKDLGRQHRERWAPREIDIDILFYGDRVVNNSDLKVPHPRILERPFCLLPAAELAPQMIFPGAGAHAGSTLQECCQSLNRPFDFNTRRILWRPDEPQLVGVLNVTPDSFSDGGE